MQKNGADIGTLDLSDRHFFTALYHGAHSCTSSGRYSVFPFMFIDLDCLKQINDRQGHHAGDHYLIQFAKVLQSCLRGSDIFARVGGDEFAVLFPECPMETAVKTDGGNPFPDDGTVQSPFSFSFGVSAHLITRKNRQKTYSAGRTRRCTGIKRTDQDRGGGTNALTFTDCSCIFFYFNQRYFCMAEKFCEMQSPRRLFVPLCFVVNYSFFYLCSVLNFRSL